MSKKTSVEWLIEQVKSKEWQDMFIWHKEEVFRKAKEMEKEQKTISDEEIKQYAKQNAFQYYEFISGAQWYREQLNKKEL